MKADLILKNYEIAKERYAALGVDTDKAIETLEKTPISLHCWQADDVVGFERGEAASWPRQSGHRVLELPCLCSWLQPRLSIPCGNARKSTCRRCSSGIG